MYYNNAYFQQNNPFAIQQAPQQQQPQMNPMMAMNAMKMFGGGGSGGLMGGGASAASGASAAGGASSGAAGGGAGAGMSALASNPVGWIAAAALAQNVAHNKGISSWQAGLKGQAGGNIGSHFMDQWGVDEDSPIRDVAGVFGWDKEGGGIFNPNYLSKKIFGSVD